VIKKNVEISNPDKILFPKSGITKHNIITYYQNIADHLLPFMHNRPLTMHRFPNGIDHEGFYQKNAPDFFPSWIKTIPIAKKNGEITHYIVCENIETLTCLANSACITPHLWLSTIDKLQQPDRLIFDLDPSSNDFDLVKNIAHNLKKLLEELGLTPYLMATGSRGLHVIVHINQRDNFDTVREFAHKCSYILEHDSPQHVTLDIRKDKRGKKVFIDTLRNSFGATAVAPYAVRAREHAPVATPLYWEELADRTLRSDMFTITTIFDKITYDGNPWKTFHGTKNQLT
jgi:bifunctional non-homologous end joining protein LigD